MEQIKNAEHLKQYVKKHPDNRMAWYLLGKQYEEQGKTAKANYCFIQAGDIFEAFEERLDPLAEAQAQVRAQAEHAMDWLRRERLRRLRIRTAVIIGVLLLLALLLPLGRTKQDGPTAQHDRPLDLSAVGVVFVDSTGEEALGAAMQRLTVGDKRAALGIAAKLQQEGQWRNWNGRTELLFAVQRSSAGGIMQMSWYESRLCNCTPADASKTYGAYESWSQEQEQRWTLQSGIQHYYKRKGQWPASIDDLVQPYPNNVLSGDTPLMRAMFDTVLNNLKEAAGGSVTGTSAGGGQGSLTGKSSDVAAKPSQADANGQPLLWTGEPMEIIVDKRTHRLALVSGNILIRSYKVGLGGDRTPEGIFAISEKVKDPNGRDDGPFGSRGMTLSDTQYAIHGTDEPLSLGEDESLGCIRMSREDIEELYDMVPRGTKVTIQQGGLPDPVSVRESRFRLEPKQDETNPRVTYAWLS